VLPETDPSLPFLLLLNLPPLQVHDHVMCCRSGSAADTQAIADIVRYYLGMHA